MSQGANEAAGACRRRDRRMLSPWWVRLPRVVAKSRSRPVLPTRADRVVDGAAVLAGVPRCIYQSR